MTKTKKTAETFRALIHTKRLRKDQTIEPMNELIARTGVSKAHIYKLLAGLVDEAGYEIITPIAAALRVSRVRVSNAIAASAKRYAQGYET